MFDAIDFKWNDEKLYKANYMQDPFNILTKENLDKLEEHCKKAIHYDRKNEKLEHQITLKLLYKYKEQQEEIERENKIIDEMAKYMYLEMPVEFYKRRGIEPQTRENLKQYFEKKVEMNK